jgi:hypothetical protein
MDWTNEIGEQLKKFRRGESCFFPEVLNLCNQAAADPDELRRFGEALSYIIKSSGHPFVVRECIILAKKVPFSQALYETVGELERSNRFARSPMQERIAEAVKEYRLITWSQEP